MKHLGVLSFPFVVTLVSRSNSLLIPINVTIALWLRHPNSHNSASHGTVGPQYYSALFLNVSHELLFHSSCCAFPFIRHAASLSSTLLNLLSFSCAFPLTGHAGLFSCCTFCGLATRCYTVSEFSTEDNI